MSSYTVLSSDDTRTIANLLGDVRRQLLSGIRERSIWTANSLPSSATQVVFSDIDDIGDAVVRRGALLEVVETGELLYVKSVQEQALTAEVVRQYDGTGTGIPAAADLQDVELRVNPIHPLWDLFQHAKQEISSLHGEGLNQFIRVDVTADASTEVVDANTGVVEIIDVYDARADVGTHTPTWRPVKVDLLDFAKTTIYPDGTAFTLYNRLETGTQVEIICRSKFQEPTALSDTMSDLGIPQEIFGAITAGIAWRVLLGQEARRTQHAISASSARAEDTQPQASAFAARAFQAMRNDLVRSALDAQIRRFPMREERLHNPSHSFSARDRYWNGYY